MQHNIPSTVVTTAGNLSVVVPDSLQLMTPYILMEQRDWFEDEIKFLRRVIKPGMQIIDIGANYGLYTLSLAQVAGESGKIWAFEPTSSVAACLSQSITHNRFNTINLIHAALSDHTGRASLSLNPNPELNSLGQPSSADANTTETVDVTTLDRYADTCRWDHIDFIKLDAEGEEANIVDGGKNTLTRLSPLIMYELKHGEKLNMPLIEKLEPLGYSHYNLIPGLDLLVPFDKEKLFDAFQLNLFGCKKTTAETLESAGFLVRPAPSASSPDTTRSDLLVWKEYLSVLPCSLSLFNELNKYQEAAPAPDWDAYQQALNRYVLSKSRKLSPADRFRMLEKAYQSLCAIVEANPVYPRIFTLIRIALEIGQRKHAVILLSGLINNLPSLVRAPLKEPFIPVSRRFEAIDPGARFKEWLVASILETYELSHAFSSYYTGQNSLQVLLKLKTLGFQSEEMDRRIDLIKKRFRLS